MLKFHNENPDAIETTNLGDSGYLLYRPSPDHPGDLDLIFTSKVPLTRFRHQNTGTSFDRPYHTHSAHHNIQANDILVIASNYMFDYLNTKQVKECIKSYFPNLK